MQYFSFISNDSYYNEAQALYVGLFDSPQPSNSGGLTYWENQLASNQTGALDAISTYATYNGQPLSSSNIGSEINNIYENLFGTPASSGGETYWASQWNGNGGTASIGQITADIYSTVENLSTTNSYYEAMNDKIMNYYNEAQALYIALFNTTATSGGLTYWENQLASNQTGALDAISTYAVYDYGTPNAAPLSSSNIGSEINNIYENLFGTPATSGGETYWASQWNGNGGSMSIGQIVAAIYNTVENLPTTNSYYEAMNNNITAANTSASLSNTLADINSSNNPQSFTMPQTFQVPVTSNYYSNSNLPYSSSYLYSYAFTGSTTQSDTLVLNSSPNNLNITDTNGNTYYGTMSYAFTGDTSGHNTVDVSYQASGNSLVNYLVNAANFQTLDFNYNGPNDSYSNVSLNLNLINSGFDNFVLDNSGFNNSFTFTNATNNDTFIVHAAANSLTVNDATYNTIGNVIMDGVQLGSLNFNGSTINIESTGVTPNGINNYINFTDNLITSMTLNVTGSQNLSIGEYANNYTYSSIGLNDGNTLNINDNSTSSLTLYFSDTSSSTNPNGVTINASQSSATLNLYDLSSDHAPNTIILGSGTDNVFTDNGNSVITAGSGHDTITVDAGITANYIYNSTSNSYSYTSYSGYMPDIQNAGTNDSITFSKAQSAYPIQFQTAQLNETSAASLNNAMVNALNDVYNLFSNGGGDFAVWFEYGNNTYIVNDYNNYGGGNYNYSGSNFQIVQLTGTVDLTHATVTAGTIHI